jgi:hypothetical protein
MLISSLPRLTHKLSARGAFLQLAHYTEPSSFSLGTSDRQLEICQQDSGMAIGAFASDLS